MKKISTNEALRQLKHGFFPKCEVARDLLKPVKTEQELKNFITMSSVQKCQFYGYEEDDVKIFKVPDDALELSINDASDLLTEGKAIYARVLGEKNEHTFKDINSFIAFLRKCDINGNNILLYWNE